MPLIKAGEILHVGKGRVSDWGSMRLGVYSKTETPEVLIKGETGNIIEQMSNHNIRNGVTKRKTFVLGKFLEGLFCGILYGVIIMNDIQRGLAPSAT